MLTTFTPLRSGVVTLALLVGLTGSARADRLEDLERRADELIETLESELEAVRRERRALEAEREALRAGAETAPGAPPAQETARRVDVLADELSKLKTDLVVPPTTTYESEHGLGPAASKIYGVERGLSIGGYGEGFFSETVSDTRGGTDRADALRLVLYTGYKFTDWLLLNAEIEFEHASTEATVTNDEGGAVSVEFAYLDFMKNDWLNARLGLVLVPVGFINEIHEPVFFHGVNRPMVERSIIPTTWREIGAGLFGEPIEGLQYRTYVHTSLNAVGFSSSGIRGGRQKGSESLAESLAVSGRVDYVPPAFPSLLIGGSAFVGETGQNQRFAGSEVDGLLSLWDVHAQLRWRGLELRGLAAFTSLGNAETISRGVGSTVGDRMQGHYLEAAYDVMPHLFPDATTQYLAPFFRYEHYDTHASVPDSFMRDRSRDTELYTLGLTWKPHPQVVLKLDYRNFEVARGEETDDVNLGAGFVF